MQEEEERSVTPPLRREEGAVPQAAEADAASGTAGVAGNDTGNGGSEDDSNEEEQEETGKTWGHAKLPPDVYGSNPFNKTRGNTQHVVWNVVKCLKKHTAHGTTVDAKYTHVCTAKITVKKAGEEGDDEDDDGKWRWYCNKILKLKKGKTCYNTTVATDSHTLGGAIKYT